ncbi:hypothetical protein [Aureimonas phyllosphaerae]|uniref:Sulfotransferase family protein n=1 Tax=Aureimonas phyllosphaerae TaxID=1166078 RepID=A0A7W6C0H4_9HYPH|nr:hypothetical protein [Aureimonas phyllosphaerae]MBB3938170.1 hypothetical protein [Aureimonas phyllosphaerae]MBB3962178.1 hypothetical protein [Aureimonas phyllosphaerae]SFF56508.1 hypothetical protein SAMN05216566_1302 [Aureimonas phyllosphaerae]
MSIVSPDWMQPAPGLRLLKRTAGAIRHIQIFGQRCSGTHAIVRTIEANFGIEARTEAYGFKHWFVPDQVLFRDDVLVLVIARNAFDWVRSLHRQPWHAHPDMKSLAFSDFVRSPWHSYWDDEFWGITERHPLRGQEMMHERDPATGLRFSSPIAKRTAKLRHWAELHSRAPNLALLSHDLLQSDARRVVEVLAAATGLPTSPDFNPVWSYKGNGNRVFEPTRYDALSPEDAQWIAGEIDPDVEALYGLPTTAGEVAEAARAA